MKSLPQIRYVAGGEGRLKAQCHCRECQYLSGGAPNMFKLMGVSPLTPTFRTSRAGRSFDAMCQVRKC
jgi:hypothetical protein